MESFRMIDTLSGILDTASLTHAQRKILTTSIGMINTREQLASGSISYKDNYEESCFATYYIDGGCSFE